MNGIHDMGGMHGFGPIEIEENEPVFHESWEGRVLAMRRTLPGVSRAYGGRFLTESIPPHLYLNSSYYERWLLSFEDALLKKGLVTVEELDGKTRFFQENPDARVPRDGGPELPINLVESLYASAPSAHGESGIVPRFAEGDSVKAGNINISGHTRLPRYVRGKVGTVAKVYGAQDIQDHVAESDKGPQPVYSVRFDGRELWGDMAEANQVLYIDMWESYLEPDQTA
jgi:nitrile hydratase